MRLPLTLALTACCLAGTPAARAGALADEVQAVLDEAEAAGAGLAIVMRDEVLLADGVGLADRATGRRMAADTQLPVASVTKIVLALGLLIALDERGLSLDATLASVAPDLAIQHRWEATHPIRIVHLLEHTTGLQEVIVGWSHGGDDPYGPVAQLVEAVRPRLQVQWPPGTAATYSNANYVIVSALIEHLTGEPFDAYLRRVLFVPLGMLDTTFRLSETDPARLAHGYRAGSAEPVPPTENFYRAAAGLISSPRDLARLLRMLLRNGDARLERPLTSLGAKNGLLIGHAPGLTVRQVQGRILRGHNGMTDGFMASLFYDRAAGFGYAVMLNAHPLPRAPSLARIRDLILQTAPPAPQAEPQATTAPTDLQALTGFYTFQNPRFYILHPAQALGEHAYVYERDGHLIKRTLLRERTLVPTGDGRFRLPDEQLPRFAFGEQDGRRYLYEAPNSYFLAGCPWRAALGAAAFAASLAVLLRFHPLVTIGAAAALVALLLPLDTMRAATTVNAATVGLALLSLALPLVALIYGARALAVRDGSARAWLVAGSLAVLTALAAGNGLIGLRPWDTM